MKKKHKKDRKRRPKSEQRRLLWHYTVGIYFKKIVSDGVLLTENEESVVPLLPGEIGALWLSSNQFWERTVRKGGAATMQENYRRYGGLIRFGFEPAEDLLPWVEFRRVSGMPAELARSMVKTGKKFGADPNEWYASLKPLPHDRWAAVEAWDGQQWVHVWPKE